jgi:putative endonuclease
MYYVYVLHSLADEGLYIGFTGNLRRRLKEHQGGESFATSFRGPWKLIYYEAYLEQADAEGRERFLKSGGGRRFLDTQLRHYFLSHPRHKTIQPCLSTENPAA